MQDVSAFHQTIKSCGNLSNKCIHSRVQCVAGHLMRFVGFCPTISGFGFGGSLGFHVESHEFDPRGLRCILLLEASAPCVGVSPAIPDVDQSGTVARNLTGGECSRVQ